MTGTGIAQCIQFREVNTMVLDPSRKVCKSVQYLSIWMAQIIGFDTMDTPQNTMVSMAFIPVVLYLHVSAQQYLNSVQTLLSLANTWFYLRK